MPSYKMTSMGRVRSFTGMGQITGMDYGNGLLYAALGIEYWIIAKVFICTKLSIKAT